MWKDRILSALLAVAVTAAATAAIVRFTPETPRFTPGQIEEGITYEVTGVPSDEIVAIVDGNGAEAELFTFWLGDTCSNLRSYYYIDVESNWDTEVSDGATLKEFVREDVLAALKQQLVTENLAARYGVTLSEEIENELAEARANNIELLGEDGYHAAIYQLGLSEAGYDRVVRMYCLNRALYDAYNTPGSELYASEDVLHAYAGSGYLTADHILIATIDLATGEPLDDEAIAGKRALAEDILARLRASDDPVALFDALADEYGEDPGRAERRGYTFTPDGYAITANGLATFVPEYLEAAQTLEENQISGLVESAYGYHILLRRPLDVPLVADTVRDEYFEALFRAELDGAEMQVSPAVEGFDVVALYDALVAAQSAEDETD